MTGVMVREEGRVSDIATVRVELGEDSRRRLLADMSGIVEARDELLLAVADYVLATNSLEAEEKAEKVRKLMDKVRAR